MILLDNHAEDTAGKRIYANHCAKCHGDDGQGGEYEEALVGERSIRSLAGLIERTMPEDDPKSIVGKDAQQVADYIYHAFYSAQARLKQRPPRIELARLTVSQYRNALADLIGAFPISNDSNDSNGSNISNDSNDSNEVSENEISQNENEAGLAAQYFQSKGMNKADALKMERIDATIDFDFGEGSPSEDIAADQFSAIWQGALRAPDTGFYEFAITTENGIRLYLNSENTGQRHKMRDDSSLAGKRALIDAWVSSGTSARHRARIFLIGGREYPLRLEFFKYKEKTASIRFEWKAPHSAWRLLDARFLHTGSPPRSFVVATPFPADDRSAGYERGSSISAEWLAATVRGATEAANEIILRLPRLAGYEDAEKDAENRLQKTKSFVLEFASRAFRRPLHQAEMNWFSQIFFKEDHPELATRKAVISILTSPSFLYLTTADLHSEPSPYHIAERLSFALWDSIPDAFLRNVAETGMLKTRAEISDSIQRMIHNDRTKTKLREFFFHWLEVEDRDLSKDTNLFPDFDESVIEDLRYSLELFIEDAVWNPASDYRNLLLAEEIYLNEPLRKLYNASSSEASDSSEASYVFSPVSFSGERSGILTHPFLLSAFAYHDMSSPIHRGVFLTRNVMGRLLKAPPVAVAFKNDSFPADLSMREKITHLTRKAACMTCHGMINPLGFTLENFDAIGRWRSVENEQPIDSSGEYPTLEGKTQTFHNARDIANFAVKSEHAHRAFIAHLFRYLTKQSPNAYGQETLKRLHLHFMKNDFSIPHLVAEIAFVAAFSGMDSQDSKITKTTNQPKL